jgi:ribonuclease P protein component
MNASYKPQTLRNSQEFRKVYDQGHRFHTPFFSVFILRNDGDEQRYGITVTRKIGGAVVRNRCKRRLREVIRNYAPSHPHLAQMGGFDLVVNVKAGLEKADFKQLELAYSQMMDRFRSFVSRQIS